MASTNTLTNIVPTIHKYGLLALRQFAVLPRLINTDYGTEAAAKGTTITIPIPSAMTAAAVVAGTPSDTNVAPTAASISLNKWYSTSFTMTDKEIAECDDKMLLAGQASEALKALVNQVESDILANYLYLYGTVGTSGSTPSTVADIINCRKLLNKQLCPPGDRFMVIDSAAEANFLALSLFTSKADTGDDALITGSLGKRLGFQIVYDQNIEGLAHTAGGADANYENHGGAAVGATSMTTEGGSGDIHKGDVFTIVGDTQQYVCSALTSDTSLTFYPGLKVAADDNDDLTFVGANAQVNIAAHRDCFALVTRPLKATQDFPNVISASGVDPVSGLAIRLEVEHTNKLTRWCWDILYGTACVRPEYGVRLIG
jgi:hypothetical protein